MSLLTVIIKDWTRTNILFKNFLENFLRRRNPCECHFPLLIKSTPLGGRKTISYLMAIDKNCKCNICSICLLKSGEVVMLVRRAALLSISGSTNWAYA